MNKRQRDGVKKETSLATFVNGKFNEEKRKNRA